MLETFLLMLAGGSAAVWVLHDGRAIAPRYFRLQTLVLLGLTVTAGALWFSKHAIHLSPSDPGLVMLAILAGGGLCLLGIRASAAGRRPRPSVLLSALAAGFLLVACLIVLEGTGGFAIHQAGWYKPLAVFGLGLGALLLGATMQGMFLGHAYLVAWKMPIGVLIRACHILIGVAVARALLASAMAGWWWFGHAEPRPDRLADFTWILLLIRLLFGLAGPIVLGWMALSAAKMRSTQSATGILYPALVLVSMGELCWLWLLITDGLAI